ncbi:endogenous retrovirus group K member 5 Gag polyprotein-like [Numida meleagris]|uniref:endogenous retrovirus group K member 5 Gag polyprotein-like n=1 Tax=Numida meleagris TaxID=8996 RepID=UPI000B3E2281|nr:endogenous retrovirus group K member 5 Gag polyprotein-like [Numida meleagris]
MERVIKVLLQLCKDYYGKASPSREEIAAVLTRLEQEGSLPHPEAVLDPEMWDSLTVALATYTARRLLGLQGDPGRGSDLGGRDGAGEPGGCALLADCPGKPTASVPVSGENKENQPSLQPALRNELPTVPDAPPPYPQRPLYPSLRNCTGGEGGCPATGDAASAAPTAGRKEVIGAAGKNAPPTAPVPLTDWLRVRQEVEDRGLAVGAYPVVVGDQGPTWVPLDPEGVIRFLEAVEKKGLRSPSTLDALEALTAFGPMLPHDIVNLMRMALKPVQYVLWEQEWGSECRRVSGLAEGDPTHPAHGTDVARLTGAAAGMATPHGQLTRLRPGELKAATDAMIDAFEKLACYAEPATPWADVVQGPAESFQEFADRLIRAVEGSDLPRAAHDPVIMDCLERKSREDVKALLRSAPDRLSTPGEMIEYVLDKQKAAPVTVEGLAAIIRAMSVSGPQRAPQAEEPAKGPCYHCGERGHVKAQCPKRKKKSVSCQFCGKRAHTARQCRHLKALLQGKGSGSGSAAQAPSLPNTDGPGGWGWAGPRVTPTGPPTPPVPRPSWH